MSSHRKVLVALVLGAVLALMLVGQLLWLGYRESTRAAEAKTRDYASILEARLDATLRRADGELQRVAQTMAAEALSPPGPPGQIQQNLLLKAGLINFPELRHLSIFDANGDVLYTSDSSAPRPNISDRSHFRTLHDNPRIDSVFSEVIVLRNSGRPGFTVTRALRDVRGAFRGVVVALIELEYFQRLFQSLDVGAKGVIAIYRSDDFTLVLRRPEVDGKLNAVLSPDSPTRGKLAEGVRATTFKVTSSTDGEARIYSVHALEAYPFLVSVGVSRDEALAGWRQRSLVTGLFTLVLLGVLIGLLVRLWRGDAARARLVAIVNASTDAIVSRDLQGSILSWNRGAEVLFGYRGTEIIGSDIQRIVPQHLRDEVWIEHEKAPALQARSYESTRLAKDGRLIDVSVGVSPIRDGAGNLEAIALIFRDITALKQAEAVAKKAVQRLDIALEGSRISVWETDLRTNQVWLDATWAALLDRAAGETRTTASALLTLVHADDRKRVAGAARETMQDRNACYVVDHRVKTDAGAWLWIQSRGKVVERDADGRPLRMSGTNTDISKRKTVEAKLRANARRLKAMFDTGPQGVTVLGANAEILEMNAAGLAMLEAESLAAAQSRPISDLIVPEYRAAFSALHRDALSGKKGHLTLEIAGLLGTRRWLEFSVASMVDADGHTTLMLGSIQDITARKQAEAMQASLEAQLRESQKMEAIGTLAGGVAHDFNNIVATIIGNADLAKDDVKGNPLALQSIHEISKAATRARDLVQQILSFSRRQPTDLKRIALTPVVLESARLLRSTLPKRITLDVQCEPDALPVLADATQMQQALLNLATNALHAMPSGQGQISIAFENVILDEVMASACPPLRELRERHGGPVVRMRVRDNGVGMSAATLGRIFEPFFTTKPVNEGTGLGLSVVHGIVKGHAGAIVVDSELGKGSTFSIYLPAVADQAVAPVAGSTPAEADRQKEGLRVLYIDDDALLVSIVTRMLGRRGYRVSAHTDQHAALEVLREQPMAFDLVLTDYNMPGMSGLDVARAVRDIRPGLPVIVTSGNIDDTLRMRAAESGVRELISKAHWADELYAAVARMTQPDAGATA